MSEKAQAVKSGTTTARKERRQKWWGQHKSSRKEGLRPRIQKTENDESKTKESNTITNATKSQSGFKMSAQLKESVATKKPNKATSKLKDSVNNVKNSKSAKKNSPPIPKSSAPKAKTIQTVNSVEADSPSKHVARKYVLFVGNLPFDITKEQLEEHFRKTGGVKTIRIPKEKGSDKTRGFAYIELKDRISHGIALRLHHTTLAGRKINVEFTSIGGGKNQQRKEKLKLKNLSLAKMKLPFEES